MVRLRCIPGIKVIKLVSCSPQLSIKFQLFMKSKMLEIKIFCVAFKHSDVVFNMLINVKIPIIVGILKFMNMINFMLC